MKQQKITNIFTFFMQKQLSKDIRLAIAAKTS